MSIVNKILLTTSRNPTPRIRSFCHDFTRVILNAVYVNRGKMSNDEVAEKTMEYDADGLIIVDRWPEGLGVLKLFKKESSSLTRAPPTIFFLGKLQREFGVSKAKPTISIVTSASDRSGEVVKFANALSGFFDLPIMEENTAQKAEGTIMHISRNGKSKIEVTFMAQPGHIEIGPRINVSRLEW